jgi:oxidoreductase
MDTATSSSSQSLRVLLLGATGATGNKVLRELLKSSRVGRVVSFTRKPIVLNEGEDGNGKLVQVVNPNFDELLSSSSSSSVGTAATASSGGAAVDEDLWKGDVAINAIGTTRALAGSGEAFVHIERDFSQLFMTRVKSAGTCKRTITISAQSANASSPGPLWFHPLLYSKTMGEKEKAALDQGFEENIIFRPGMLDREMPAAQL